MLIPLTLVHLSLLILCAFAQDDQQQQQQQQQQNQQPYWSIPAGVQIQPCAQIPIVISPNASGLFTPPYTMNAYPDISGSPTFTQLVQSADGGFEWTVVHSAPTELILSLTDSSNKSLGVLPTPYFVSGFTSPNCIPTPPCPSFLLFASTSGGDHISLSPCDKLFLNFTGASNNQGKPYVVTVITSGTNGGYGSVEQFTMGGGDNQFVWIDRENVPSSGNSVSSSAGANVVAYARDSFGAYSSTTKFFPLLPLPGRDTTCPNSGPTLSSGIIPSLSNDGVACVHSSSNNGTTVQFGGGGGGGASSNSSSNASASSGGVASSTSVGGTSTPTSSSQSSGGSSLSLDISSRWWLVWMLGLYSSATVLYFK